MLELMWGKAVCKCRGMEDINLLIRLCEFARVPQ